MGNKKCGDLSFRFTLDRNCCLQTVVEQVCRLARTIASPHETSHSVLVAEGCPGRATIIVKLAAHLCGYTVHQINPTSMGSSTEYKMDQFKADLVQGYTRAGSRVRIVILFKVWYTVGYSCQSVNRNLIP